MCYVSYMSADQPPVAVVFSCAEDPISDAALFDQPTGTLISVRTWGHMLDFGVLSSIEYAVGAFHLPLVVVLGHDGCTALEAAGPPCPLVDGHARKAFEQIGFALTTRCRHLTPAVVHLDAVCSALVQRSTLLTQRVSGGDCAVVGVMRDGCGRAQLSCHFGDVGELVTAGAQGLHRGHH